MNLEIPSPGSGPVDGASGYHDEEESSLLDLTLVLIRRRKTIIRVTGIFVLLGLAWAIFGKPQYTASVRLIRESVEMDLSQGSAVAALRGLGLSFGGGGGGLTEDTFPEILTSQDVNLVLVRQEYYFPDLDTMLTLGQYDIMPKSLLDFMLGGLRAITIDLPGHILRAIRGTPDLQSENILGSGIDFPTYDEEKSIRRLKKKTSINIDRKSGIMSVTVTTHHPLVSVQIINAMVIELTERIRQIVTLKAQQNLDFLEDKFAEADSALRTAEDDLAEFTDQNRDIRSAQLRTQQERYERKVDFKSKLYEELQTQVTQASIELQRTRPVITMIESPVPPHKKSAPRRKLIVIMSLFLGVGFGIAKALLDNYSHDLAENEETQSKWAEIEAVLDTWLGRVAFWRIFGRRSRG